MHERDRKDAFDRLTALAEAGKPEWKCANCGIPTPGRVRACDCTTEVVFCGDPVSRRTDLKLSR